MARSESLVGSMPFGPVVVEFDERVLRPRPWTLAQAEWGDELAAFLPPLPLLELCCGAGHIGLALAAFTGRRVVQVDVDEAACEWATINAERAGLSELIEVRHGPMETTIRSEEQFPLILADPPYVPTADVDRFPDDPPLAIDGGQDGMDLVHRCLEVAGSHLTPGGYMLLQVGGPDQVEAVDGYVRELPAIGLAVVDSRSFGPTRSVVRLSGNPPVP